MRLLAIVLWPVTTLVVLLFIAALATRTLFARTV